MREREIEQIELAGLLHDIGKIGIEDRILMKPARLDWELLEREIPGWMATWDREVRGKGTK